MFKTKLTVCCESRFSTLVSCVNQLVIENGVSGDRKQYIQLHCMSDFSIISEHNIQCSLCLNFSNILIVNNKINLQCSAEITIQKFACKSHVHNLHTNRMCTMCIYASASD